MSSNYRIAVVLLVSTLATLAMHAIATESRGYEAVGGEFIPLFIVLVAVGAYKYMDRRYPR